MPIDNHASALNQNGDGSKLKKKINKLSDKHKGLYNSVIEGYGQNKYTSGNYDKDYKKLGKVEDRLGKKEKKYSKKFGKSPYSMEGPLDKGCAKSEGVSEYKRKNPGSKLKTAVTGKVKPGSKAAKRRKSFCARSKSWTGERGKAARRRWKC
jgi:hypothetical protein